MKQRMQHLYPSVSKYDSPARSLRGTCDETEDATNPFPLTMRNSNVLEALALKQRMQRLVYTFPLRLELCLRGTCAETEDATSYLFLLI